MPEDVRFVSVPKFQVNPIILALFLGGLFLLALGAGMVFFRGQGGEDVKVIPGGVAGESSYAKASEDKILVHIDGAVVRPGVYKLGGDARVDDAVAAAGGMTTDAESTKVNLAAKLVDGQKVMVPRVSAEQSFAGQAGLVSINSGTQAELESLPGVGPVTAQKIMSLRPYGSVEELLGKKAVSSVVYQKVKDLVSP